MEANEKIVLIRNGDAESIADHINSFIEVGNVEGGKKVPIELYKDSIGEHILLFPHNIPYQHFTVLLNAFDAPWFNNSEGLQVAGWAQHNEEMLMLFATKNESGLLIGISADGKQYAVTPDESAELESETPLPVEYYNYTFDKDKAERVALFELLIDETLPVAEEDEVEDEAQEETAIGPIKKINTATIVVVIVVASALLIWLLSMAS